MNSFILKLKLKIFNYTYFKKCKNFNYLFNKFNACSISKIFKFSLNIEQHTLLYKLN